MKQGSVYPDYCSIELCDDIEQAYEPVCECWCGYDGGEPDDGGDDGTSDPDGPGDDGGGSDGGEPDDGGGDPDDGGGDPDETSDPDGPGEGSDDDGGDGCTLTQGYWKNHNEFQTNRNQDIDWPAAVDEQDLLCGETLLDILNHRAGGDAWYILAHQYIAASLNEANGASTPAASTELDDARELLLASCDGIAAGDRATAIGLSEVLDAYNNGVIGPGHCD